MNNISIITVTYNALDDLKKTVDSVFECFAHDHNIEFIIVDGASTDGTVDFINKLHSSGLRFRFISEPDTGIYNAMNKGISLLSDMSEYVVFMNAGDYFLPNARSVLFERKLTSDIHVFNVESIDTYNNPVVVRRGSKVKDIEDWPSYPHQGTLIRSTIHKKNGYQESYRILADYDFFSSCYNKGNNITLEKEFISVFVQGGVSSSASSISDFIAEFKEIQLKHFGSINYTIILGLRIKWLIRRLGVSAKLENLIRRMFLK